VQERLRVVIIVVVAAASWWGILALTGRVRPEQPGSLIAFFLLLFVACTATLALPLSYLNRRLAPGAVSRAPGRFLRHSVWGGLCLTSWTWLQMHRALNLSFALITTLIFLAAELLIVRIRGETG
jgi:hypothetical protein